MLLPQLLALAACVVVFLFGLAYSADLAHWYHNWYKKEKEAAKARDMLNKLKSSKPSALGEESKTISEEQAVARAACPFAKFAEKGSVCPVSGESNKNDQDNTKDSLQGGPQSSGRPEVPTHPRKKYGGWYVTNKMTTRKLMEQKTQ